MVKLAVVTTMYSSRAYLEEFHRRCVAAASQVTDDLEVVYVNDGSPDDSLDAALKLREGDGRVTVVDLSRNFGHHRAILEGLAATSAERVFLLDCDLEESPEWLLDFSRALDAEPALDVVFGVQERRKGGLFERLSGAAFWKLFNALSGLSIPESALTVRLMTRRYVDALLAHDETEVFLGGLLQSTGFRQRAVPVEKRSRGASSYSLRRKVSLFVNAVTSFSAVPVMSIFYLGMLVFLASLVMATYLVVRKLFWGDVTLIGWTSLMLSTWFLSGLLMMSMGVVGLYLSRIFMEVKRRPRAIVRALHRGPRAG